MSRPALSPFPPGQTGLQSTPSFLSSLPGHLSVGQQHQQPGGAGQHGTGASVVTSASNLGLLPGHLEIGRQLDGAFDEELRTLEQLGEAFYDELDATLTGSSDAKRRQDALKALQAQLAHVISISRAGLGAIPLPFPPPPALPSADVAVDGAPEAAQPVPAGAQEPTLEALNERWAGELQGLFGRRQAFKEGVSVAEGVFKRAA